MIESRKILGRSPRESRRGVVMINWPFLVRKGRKKEKVPKRRVIVKKDHRS
jgi:hypothetical protein